MRFAESSRRERQTNFKYFWISDNKVEFMLSVKDAQTAEGTLLWRMYQGSGHAARELWFHVSSDLRHIYTMVINSSGQDLEAAVKHDLMTTVKMSISPLKQDQTDTFDGVSSVNIKELLKSQETALEGELGLVEMPNLLQSIAMSRLSGRLRIEGRKGIVDIFFANGAPIHARGSNGDGLDCALQTVGWSEGKFKFEPNLKTDTQTIDLPTNTVLMQGIHLLDNTEYLLKSGIRNDSMLARTNHAISESDFEALMTEADPHELEDLKRFYLIIDDKSTLGEIVERAALPRSKWVHLLSQLLRASLVKGYLPAVEELTPQISPKQINHSDVNLFIRASTSEEDGLMTYAAFLYLLERDLLLHKDVGKPLSVVLFELHLPDAKSNLIGKPSDARSRSTNALRRISESINAPAVLSHYEKKDYALLLPNMPALAARALCDRIAESMAQAEIGMDAPRLVFGISSAPQDGSTREALLARAEFRLSGSTPKGII